MDASTQLQLNTVLSLSWGFGSQKEKFQLECKHPLATANGSVLSATVD